MLVGGEWSGARDGATFNAVSPVTGELLAEVPDAGPADAALAIDAAAEAFDAWSGFAPEQRAGMLERAAELLLERREELARLAAIEQGKPVAEARGEVAYAAGFLRFFAHEAGRGADEELPVAAAGKRVRALRRPIGVAGLITIWNFPLAGVTRPLAAALASGCTAVLKPAEQTPLCATAIFEALDAAGLPAGAANLVTTADPEPVGRELISSPAVPKLCFTGSAAVGRRLLRGAADRIKRVTLELGGHAPFLVFADADLEAAARGAVASKFRNTGQTCVALNRILVEAPVAEAFSERFAALAGELRLGDPRREDVDLGPMIDDAALARVERQVDDARALGARVLLGGRRRADPDLPAARFFEPTVLVDATSQMLVMREETFGPVAPIAVFSDEEEALDAANSLPWGLAAFVYTSDEDRARRLAERLEFGIVGLNDPLPGAPEVPFGGLKQSGLGKEGGRLGLEEFLEVKLVSEARWEVDAPRAAEP